MTHKRLLLVDGMNNFLRCYVVNPSLDLNGNHVGGVVGFLNALKNIMIQTKPDEVIIAWEGANGSRKRKEIYKGYKAGRKPPRLNREYETSPEEEAENKLQQIIKLTELLELLPVLQLSLDDVEADDVIAWAAKQKKYADWQKVIVSNDKDFLQLCNESTIVLRPTQKQIYNAKKVLEDFSIHPSNFAIAKAISGDKSDNIIGADRVGIATVAKRFPFLSEDKEYTLQDVFDYCEEQADKPKCPKAYLNILDHRDVISTNFDIVQLDQPLISLQGMSRLTEALDDSTLELQKNAFRLMIKREGFTSVATDSLFENCMKIVVNKN